MLEDSHVPPFHLEQPESRSIWNSANPMKSLESKPQTLPIMDIIVGERHRRDLGDIDALARSIAEVGLLHPIPIRPDCILIAGTRRLAACKTLGWQDIPVHVVELDKIARGEIAENAYRKKFLPSEIFAIWQELEPIERAAAEQRQRATRFGAGGGKFPPPNKDDEGKTRDKVAAAAGLSGRTLDKISAIMEAAEADPSYGPLVMKMDQTGKVDGVYRELQGRQQAERIRAEPPPLPNNGPYRIIVVDAAWNYDLRADDPSQRGRTPYPTMTLSEIKDLPITSIAHPDCALWMWTTNAHIRDAFDILSHWGFEYKTMLTWAKPNFGTGNWLRGQTEHCLLAVRGNPVHHLTNQSTLLCANKTNKRRHSEKPEAFYELVESLCPAPRYASLFHCGPVRPNWDAHGAEHFRQTCVKFMS